MPPSTQASRIDRMMPEARPDRVPARLLRCVVRRLSVAVLAGLAAAAAPRDADRLRSPDDLRALEARIGAVAGRVRETVVAIVVPDDGGAERGSGSGTIISPDGWVLTAGHVGQAGDRAPRGRDGAARHDGRAALRP
jgi:hypothetical protein